MSEGEVLYSEVKFKRRGGTTDGTASSPPDSEVRILSTQPSSELPASQQQLVSNGRSKVTPERAAFVVLAVVLGVLLAAAVIVLVLTSYKKRELVENLSDELDAVRRNLTAYKNLSDELDAVRRNLTAYKELLQNLTDKLDGQEQKVTECEEGWERCGGACYYVSTSMATWEESSRECGCRGATLARIGSTEEKGCIERILRGQMYHLFWIGLTDSKEEGTWLWADGSPLSLAFWRYREPDDYKKDAQFPDGEDCVVTLVTGYWSDQPCGKALRHICDKPAQTSRLKCV